MFRYWFINKILQKYFSYQKVKLQQQFQAKTTSFDVIQGNGNKAIYGSLICNYMLAV